MGQIKMKKYAKIENEETKQCSVGLGTNIDFYKSIGMVEMDVEQAYNGRWYLMGYAPEPTSTEKIAELKQKLSETDYIIIKIAEGSSTKEEYADIIKQRQEWRKELNDLGI
jgi:hypothetical protein